MLKDERDMSGVPSGPGSRPTDGAAQGVSTADAASIPNAGRSVAERLGGMKVVVTCSGESTELALSGKLTTRDELDALGEALDIMRDWLRDAEQSEMTDDDEDLYDALREDDLSLDENLAASAIEAQRAGTTEIGPVADESAIPKGDAQ